MRTLLFICCCTFVLAHSALANHVITTGSLVGEMVDLARLGDFPDPYFKTVQFSSYDRRSKAPNTPGWYANSDGFGGEPIPGFLKVLEEPGGDGVGTYLMVEVSGPGAIARTWTARIGGDLQVHLDGSEKPVYDGSASDFMLDKYGYYARKLRLPLEGVGDAFHQRDADYFPISFAKSCRIVWKGKLRELHFYQIQVREYADGAAVRTFQPEDLKTYADRIQRAISILQNPGSALDELPSKEEISLDVSLNPAQKLEAIKTDRGPAAIHELALKIEAGDLQSALRQTILRITFDDHPVPQVESPVGDFFAAAPGVNPYETLPMTVKPDGTMVCRFVMPFARSMSLTLDNWGQQSVKVAGKALLCPYNWRADRSMHFRARWRVNHDLLAAPGDGAVDLPFLVATGEGVYVGTVAILMNPSPVPTAWGNWWGEGDEKVFVDGESFPSTFGTGSEDYFNYSWSNCELFEHPYCTQPVCTGPDTRGYVSNSRWQILDALPFKQEIAFYMELYSHRRTPGLSYARIAYHYARPGIRDDCVPIMVSDAVVPPLPEAWQPIASHGSGRATFYQAESLEAEGDGEVRILESEMWSAAKLLSWCPKKKGDKLSLSFEVQKPGRYAIVMTSAVTPESGSFSGKCDDRQLTHGDNATVLDLRTAHRTMLRNFFWNPLELKTGEHVLVLESAAENDSGSTVGLDFIWLLPR